MTDRAQTPQANGADIIELGMPFSDPMADGGTIQKANSLVLSRDPAVRFDDVIAMTTEAREKGLTIPVVMMGYYNPLLAFGLDNAGAAMMKAGIDGMIVVDLPPEEGGSLLAVCQQYDLSYIPLIAPTSTDERIETLAKVSTSFVYCVSVAGVTGARSALPDTLPAFLARVKSKIDLPICVGFGISKPEHVRQVGEYGAAGAVVGSAIVAALDACGDGASSEERAAAVGKLVSSLTGGKVVTHEASAEGVKGAKVEAVAPRADFMFGEHGGQYIPETLVETHMALAKAYQEALADPSFVAEYKALREGYIGGPTPLYYAERLTKDVEKEIGRPCGQVCHYTIQPLAELYGGCIVVLKVS
jgi:tryptophan synthase